MLGNQQHYERLIRLEDDELDSTTEKHRNASCNDSCHVKIDKEDDSHIVSGEEVSEHGCVSRQIKYKPLNQNIPGLSFNFSGAHIYISPEQLKYISLVTLTIQNAALNLTMRAARTQREEFSTPVAVTISEVFKLVTCIGLIWYEQSSLKPAIKHIHSSVIENYVDTLKVAVPSFVYYVQNNLLYVGSTHLDAATSQVTYQLKILTTAIFSVLMLNKSLSKTQWMALIALFVGVALIETVAVADHTSKEPKPGEYESNNVTTRPVDSVIKHEKPIMGFVAILIACCLSGFAGVYFERILKNSAQVSLWIRNIQLSAATIPIGLVQVLITEHEHIATKGLLYGFTPLTWFCISLQVQGGLLVAVVVKFANNILKGFATSMAIVISTIASMFLFDFNLTPIFVLGSGIVICSVMMYNKQ